MTDFTFDGPLFQARTDLDPVVPLYMYLVKGATYAVWIDSGIQTMFPLLQATMDRAGVAPQDLRFVLHTHSHHDHIGCNAQLRAATGCLIAAPSYYAAWHADFERQYQEFARPFPHLMPDTPALRDEVLSFLDAPVPLDLHIDEGVLFDLGGGVTLRAYSLPGHMLAELGWFESSTRTLILGDAITRLDWPQLHSHLTVSGYPTSLDKIRRLLTELDVRQVLAAHFALMTPAEANALVERAHAYIDSVERTIIRFIASQSAPASLGDIWEFTCRHMERRQEFRALNMVHAHLLDLLARGLLREPEPEHYTLR